MAELKDRWAIIKSPTATDEEKEAAKKRINELEKQFGYQITDFNKPYTPKGTTGKSSSKSDNVGTVIWPLIPSDEDAKRLASSFERVQGIAVSIAKKQHPDMSENSNVFGQIVNAIVTNLINLGK